jgi:hypothetical protein
MDTGETRRVLIGQTRAVSSFVNQERSRGKPRRNGMQRIWGREMMRREPTEKGDGILTPQGCGERSQKVLI